jgi:isoaspartyl peptidase/L-asparaginase-like protein (Ntn-hydrolase superfamily)
MSGKRLLCFLLSTAILIGGSAVQAQAFCGVIEESAVAETARKAMWKANNRALKQIRKLKRQHGRKLVVESESAACAGGAVAIDSDGNQIVGESRCTVTRGYCVNP